MSARYVHPSEDAVLAALDRLSGHNFEHSENIIEKALAGQPLLSSSNGHGNVCSKCVRLRWTDAVQETWCLTGLCCLLKGVSELDQSGFSPGAAEE